MAKAEFNEIKHRKAVENQRNRKLFFQKKSMKFRNL
jgi:hypothetical protein